MEDKKLTEKEVRKEFKEMRKKDKTFAEVWADTDRNFYEWCSQYLDYKHIKERQ